MPFLGSDEAEAIRELKQSQDEHSRILINMGKHFDERFDTFDEQLDTLDEQFDTLERRFKTLDAKIDSVLNRLSPLP